jgi:DNA modification methylase
METRNRFKAEQLGTSHSHNKTRNLPRHNSKLEIAYKSIAILRPDPKNARVHTDRQVQQIANSIEAFGFVVPVLVDTDLQVIAGHGRVLACKLLGMRAVPVIMLSHLSENQIRAFKIADNRLSENAEWDHQLLGEQLKILSDAELDFTVEITGFETGEIDLFIESFAPAANGETDPADIQPELSATQVNRPGDLWNLGKHRVFCGDALSSQSYQTLMDGRRANVIFSDPPFNVPISGHVSGNGKFHHREFVMASGEMTEPEFIAFLRDVLKLLAQHSLNGSLHYICMDWRHMRELLEAGTAAYSELKNLCVWAKSNAGMGSFYRSQHELVFVFQNGVSTYRNNIQLGRFGRSRSNVWHYPGANSFSRSSTEGNLLALHPTVKPVALVGDAIMDCSARGDLVLDPFLGSGTTIIAAERTGRICNGMELDPCYVDTVIRRWQKLTKLEAIHAVSGRTFAQREKEVPDAQ